MSVINGNDNTLPRYVYYYDYDYDYQQSSGSRRAQQTA